MSKGLVFIHQAPRALITHVEWTISGICGNPVAMNWHNLPDPLKGFRSVASWQGPAESGVTLATSFMSLRQISFEVIQQDFLEATGYRWSFTPNLGMFSSAIDEAGNILVGENRIRAIVEECGSNGLKLQAELRRVLGQSFDDELELYRELIDGSEGHDGVVPTKAERISYGQNI